MTNPKFAAIVEAARQRTAKLVAESSTTGLAIAQSKQQSYESVHPKALDPIPFEGSQTITINGNTFNPYEIEGLELNAEQRKAVDWFGIEGRSGCLIGPAGTGKTTTMRAIIR